MFVGTYFRSSLITTVFQLQMKQLQFYYHKPNNYSFSTTSFKLLFFNLNF